MQECEAALVFFRNRYDALVVSHTIQSADPMLWVTELAPEPKDVFWQNLCVPFNLLWIRKISVFIASIIFSVLFLLPTTFVQGLMKLEYLHLVLTVFLIIVPPTMMLFSTLEGAVSRSTRKRSACVKVLIFMFWNVYFSNILSGSWIERMGKLTPVGLLGNWLFKCVLRKEEEFCRPVTFSYHTEVSRVLLFGLLGFTFCILAPLILPFLLVYFFFAFLIMNVYFVKYQTDGSYWPLAHNATIFSLILTQVVAAVLFGMKKSSSASTSTIPLIILTALFNVFCKNRFLPVFKNRAAQVLIEMDRDDERSGKLEAILEKLTTSYNQFELCGVEPPGKEEQPKKGSNESLKDLAIVKTGSPSAAVVVKAGSPSAEVVVNGGSPTAEVVVKSDSPSAELPPPPPPPPPPELEPEPNIVSI
ncbi:protein of unknown function DUF221, partial [Cynara cardunculus var. scolymus]